MFQLNIQKKTVRIPDSDSLTILYFRYETEVGSFLFEDAVKQSATLFFFAIGAKSA